MRSPSMRAELADRAVHRAHERGIGQRPRAGASARVKKSLKVA
jgi:hypothetical protein